MGPGTGEQSAGAPRAPRDKAKSEEGVSRYVQHISGQGEKWEVVESFFCSSQWAVKAEMFGSHHFLPKSEYKLLEPPERWVDISTRCVTCERVAAEQGSVLEDDRVVIARIERGYRLRKVLLWTVQPSTNILGESQAAFLVERREP
jgi:hypothetical protein